MTNEQVVQRLHRHAGKFPTMKAAAVALGITQVYLADILKGRRTPGPKVLKALGLQKSYARAK